MATLDPLEALLRHKKELIMRNDVTECENRTQAELVTMGLHWFANITL